MRPSSIFLLALAAAGLIPAQGAGAQTVEELKAKLAAQEQVNELLKQRIATLEAERDGRKASIAAVTAPPSDRAGDDPEEDRALERTLVHRGIALLPAHALQLTPSLAWSHSGTDFDASLQNLYGAGLEGRYGLPGGWMVGAGMAFLHRDSGEGAHNTGVGDASVTVWKSLLVEDDTWPSLVASVRYIAPTGEGVQTRAPLGSGFHSVTTRLSSVKTIAPAAFYGELAYTAYVGDTFSNIAVHRGGAFSIDLGTSLAVTPEISLTAGIGFSFEDAFAITGVKIDGSGVTRGVVEIGAGFLLTRNVFLVFSGAFGVTADAPDATLGISVPVRF